MKTPVNSSIEHQVEERELSDYWLANNNNMSEENFQKLQVVQNHCARLVKKAPKRSSATSLLKDLHWLPIKFRVSYKVAIFVFKCLNDDSFPSYLKDLISVYTPSRTLRSSDKFL